MTLAPTLSNARVTLRQQRLSDLDSFRAFYATPRAALMDQPASASALWYEFASDIGSWALIGTGAWAIETPDGQLAGQVAILHPPHFPEREIGWLLFDGFEGRGLAFAGASLALDWAFGPGGLDTLVSYVHRDNRRSAALAQRLGAVVDPSAECHDPADVVYRHSATARAAA